MKTKLPEITCPKCGGEGLEIEKKWVVEFCGRTCYGCYKETENKVMCKTCMGVKTITILEVTE